MNNSKARENLQSINIKISFKIFLLSFLRIYITVWISDYIKGNFLTQFENRNINNLLSVWFIRCCVNDNNLHIYSYMKRRHI